MAKSGHVIAGCGAAGPSNWLVYVYVKVVRRCANMLFRFFSLSSICMSGCGRGRNGLGGSANRPQMCVVHFLTPLTLRIERGPRIPHEMPFVSAALHQCSRLRGEGHFVDKSGRRWPHRWPRLSALCTRHSNDKDPCQDARFRTIRIGRSMKEQTSEVKIAPAADQSQSSFPPVNGHASSETPIIQPQERHLDAGNALNLQNRRAQPNRKIPRW